MLNSASHFPAPVQSTTSMVVTNHDDSIQPEASIEHYQAPSLPDYQKESLKPSSLIHAEDHFLPTKAIKTRPMNKGIWLATAALGGLYLSNRWEQATAEKAKLKMIEKLKIAAAHSSASNTTNTLLAWFLGLGGTGLVTGVGIKAAELTQASDARKLAEAANNKLDGIRSTLGNIHGTMSDANQGLPGVNAKLSRLDDRLIGNNANGQRGLLRDIRRQTWGAWDVLSQQFIHLSGPGGRLTHADPPRFDI